MKKFNIAVFYKEEAVEWWNNIEAETLEQARQLVLDNAIDPTGHETLDSERTRIEEWDDKNETIQELDFD